MTTTTKSLTCKAMRPSLSLAGKGAALALTLMVVAGCAVYPAPPPPAYVRAPAPVYYAPPYSYYEYPAYSYGPPPVSFAFGFGGGRGGGRGGGHYRH